VIRYFPRVFRGRSRVLEDHIAELDRRADEIARARAMTEHALRCRSHDITECPRFRSHVGDVLTGATAWSLSPETPGAAASRAVRQLP
jgi:MerR family transcriptional regulator, copper efflux regulator